MAFLSGDLTVEFSLNGTKVKIGGKDVTADLHPRVVAQLEAQHRPAPKVQPWQEKLIAHLTVPEDLITTLTAEPERERTFGTEPLIGWRAWKVKPYRRLDDLVEPRLAPVYDKLLWHPRERAVASCTAAAGERMTAAFLYGEEFAFAEHEAPQPDCRCGLWAVRERAIAESKAGSNGVFGKVAMWGRVLEFEHGFRAQYAYPTELYGTTRNEATVRQLGELYGVPVRVTTAAEPEPGELFTRFVHVDLGVNVKKAQKAMMDMQNAMLAASKTMSANELRKQLRLPPLDSALDNSDAEQLAVHAAAGSHVVDVYPTAAAARVHIDALEQQLVQTAIKHRRDRRFRILFQTCGGSYEAIAASDDRMLLQHLRGRRPNIIHLRGAFSTRARAYIRAHGIQILEEFEAQLRAAVPMTKADHERLHLNRWTPPLTG